MFKVEEHYRKVLQKRAKRLRLNKQIKENALAIEKLVERQAALMTELERT